MLADNPARHREYRPQQTEGDLDMNASGVERICKWIAAGLIAAVAFGVTGCGKKEEQSAGTNKAASVQRVVKIGHAAPLTGGIAHLGKDNENGVRLAIDEANAKGLSIGG